LSWGNYFIKGDEKVGTHERERIILLTIGQTPRPDLLRAFEPSDGNELQIVGALDGISDEKIKQMEDFSDDVGETLFVVLQSGTAHIDHRYIEVNVERIIETYSDDDVLIIILCMSDFHATALPNVISPLQMMMKKVTHINRDERVLITVPIAAQLESAQIKWQHIQGEKKFVVVNPKDSEACQLILQAVKSYHSDHVIMDCYGYDYRMVAAIQRNHRCTVYNGQNMVRKIVLSPAENECTID
jgi:hypothetical protein